MRALVWIFLLLASPCRLFSQADFCMFSSPKCGTHLLTRVLQELTGRHPLGIVALSRESDLNAVERAKREQAFVYTHQFSPWQCQELIARDYKFFFIYRDPRDQIISFIYWLDRLKPDDPYYPLQFLEISALIEECITGDEFGFPIYEVMDVPNFEMARSLGDRVCSVKLEDLTGANGGGSTEKQIEAILRIAHFIDIPLTPQEAEAVGARAWGSPGTFRKGTLHQWKEYFTPRHVELYKERYGQILIESSSSWDTKRIFPGETLHNIYYQTKDEIKDLDPLRDDRDIRIPLQHLWRSSFRLF